MESAVFTRVTFHFFKVGHGYGTRHYPWKLKKNSVQETKSGIFNIYKEIRKGIQMAPESYYFLRKKHVPKVCRCKTK